MATEPLVTAASNNPALSTLASAIKEAGLADKLNTVKDITIFAPTNDAFAKIPKAQLDKILADKKTLSDILNYHIVGQRLTPEALSSGTFNTLQGGTIRTTRSGDSYRVGNANMLCGNLPTANGTVYIIDSVLMPRG
ncbi:fasciclin domain-containing protein [Actinomadura sp. HBU206391]|uniref:fasciclin domain-containing protein n=1 Tax=Actinomadura sp. HBU206391 TaxID=2731692 RepID=UPI0021C6781D|nr:fasciclin domain-containing protein [Actinomadura sp. HBU206391]